MKLERTVQADSLKRVLQALASGLTPTDNFLVKLLGPITTPGVADTEFTVSHNLGVVPTNYIWNVDRACTVYDSRRANWTGQQLFLKCSAASATLYLIVF